MKALNEGREETITLAEWLAIDMATLLRSILSSVGLAKATQELVEFVESLAGEGVTTRERKIGEAKDPELKRQPGSSIMLDVHYVKRKGSLLVMVSRSLRVESLRKALVIDFHFISL